MTVELRSKKNIATDTLLAEFSLADEFSFLPGQYLTLTISQLAYPDKRGNSRIFSIVNSPTEKGIIKIATRLTGSGFKKTLAEAAPGTKMEIGRPEGDFILPAESDRRLVFIAGGVGITPFMSMIKYTVAQKTDHQIVLIYSNRNRESIAFFDELTTLMKKNPNIKIIFTMTEEKKWPGEKRKINTEFIKQYTEPDKDFYLVAGPATMVETITADLSNLGVMTDNIKKENFIGY